MAGENGETTVATGENGISEEAATRIAKTIESLKAKYNGADRAMEFLVTQARDYRKEIKDLEAKFPEGAVVLTGDDAKRWADYRTLGDPVEVRKAVDEGNVAKKQASELERKAILAEVAEIADPKAKLNAKVLAKLLEGRELVIKEVEEDGKVVRQPFVKGENGKTTPVMKVILNEFAEYLPSLRPGRERPDLGTPPRKGGLPRDELDSEEAAVAETRDLLRKRGLYGAV